MTILQDTQKISQEFYLKSEQLQAEVRGDSKHLEGVNRVLGQIESAKDALRKMHKERREMEDQISGVQQERIYLQARVNQAKSQGVESDAKLEARLTAELESQKSELQQVQDATARMIK